jgi:two-component system CheB/CheR fusion protein
VTAADEQTVQQPNGEPFYVVGLGASAGGLAALKTFFSGLPSDPGIAFVVVVHLSPEHESHLAELLQPHCPIPIQQVTETVVLEPNRVYVIPPNANLNTIDTHLRLSELEHARRERAPIDHFLETLAVAHEDHAIGIVLSGTGSDGTSGLRQIKEHGGLTIAQDPVEATYDNMPRNAITSGVVDLVLPLGEMPEQVLMFARIQPSMPSAEAEHVESVSGERALQKVFARIRAVSGRDFTCYKRSTIMRRIRRRMQLLHVQELGAYLEILRRQEAEARALADDLLITVTEFFRDAESFQALEQRIIPRLFEGKGPADAVRVWTIGCSTGEEAYSLAILLMEEAARRDEPPRVQVFASDLHDGMLKKAREGVYPESIQTSVSPQRLSRFFRKDDSHYHIHRAVREIVTFAMHDLLRDPPFAHVDLIACRNLLIYFQRDAQEDLISIAHYALNHDGYLMLGVSESVERSELFAVESKEHSIYRRRNVPNPELHVPHFSWSSPRVTSAELPDPTSEPRSSFGALHERIVERYAPPSMLVNEHHDVVHYSAHAGRFLQIPGGQPTNNAIKLVREPLRIELRAALYAAQESGTNARSRPIPCEIDGRPRHVVLRVQAAEEADLNGYHLVIFDEVEPADEGAADASNSFAVATTRELEAELDLTKRRLQTSIDEHETAQEEMQASLEELQSTNEELRSTMEELETSKEELQSTNEELTTANQENRHRVEELNQLTADLQNLMAATHIATLFLDRDLRILRFTPQVTELFCIRLTDRGRPLSDLTHRLMDNRLYEDAQQTLEQLTPVERELQDQEGRWYLTRVLPYRATDDRIEGVVLTFIDITRRKAAQLSLLEREEQLRVLVETAAVMVWETNAAGQVQVDSTSWRAHTGQSLEDWQGEGWLNAVHPEDRDHVLQIWRQAVSDQVPLNSEFRVWHVSGTWRWTNVRAAPVRNQDGSVRKWVGMNIDITERKEAEAALHELNRTLEQQVAERTAVAERRAEDLRRLATQLSQAEHLERQRLAVLLHDNLQQTLVAVKLRLPELGETEPDQLPQRLEVIEDLVGECLSVSRSLTQELSPAVLQMGTLGDVVQWLGDWYGERHGLDVTVQVPAQLPQVPEHVRIFLFHSLRELLLNVVKHTERSAACVSVSTDDGHLSVQVEDQGENFDPRLVEDRLKQPEGFGLFNIRERVEALGGRLEVQATPRGGACFCLVVPITDHAAGAAEERRAAATAAAPDDGAARTPAGDGIRVLVVDDHAIVRECFVRQLDSQPDLAVVGEAANGQEAIQRAKALQPDVILMDVDMPHMDGIEAARQITQQCPHIAIIGLSLYEDDTISRRMTEAGASAYVSKNIHASELNRVIRRVLAGEWHDGHGK